MIANATPVPFGPYIYLFCLMIPYVVHKPLVNKFAKIIVRGRLFTDLVLITVKMVESGAAN